MAQTNATESYNAARWSKEEEPAPQGAESQEAREPLQTVVDTIA